MRLLKYCAIVTLVFCYTLTAHAQLPTKQVSDITFITTENGTRIEIKVSGPVQITRKELKGYFAFTISPAKYVNKSNQISVQNPFVEFIYSVQRTDQDVYVLIKLKITDQVNRLMNESGNGNIIVEILNRPPGYPVPVAEKKILPERTGAPYTPEAAIP